MLRSRSLDRRSQAIFESETRFRHLDIVGTLYVEHISRMD